MADIGVVGGGILGLAVARELQQRHPGSNVTVLEKEPAVGTHQTARNSGVVHAGLYYTPGSLKAQLCTRGMRLLRRYCDERDIVYDECGKLLVAVDDTEVPRLHAIAERGRVNGVPGLRVVPREEIRTIEPHAAGVLGLLSPHTAITDFAAVAAAYAEDVRKAGGEIRTGAEVTGLVERRGRVEVTTTHPATPTLVCDHLVVCGGLHGDRLAAMAGDSEGPRIVPFRGDYYLLRPERRDLVRGLIYPVPDPRYPFLGIHLTKRVDGEVLVGPNAVLATAREGYRVTDFDARDVLDTLRWPGFRSLARTHWRTGAREVANTVSRRVFVSQARRYVPDLRAGDVVRGPSGVRAQALDPDGSLVDDFRISRRGPVTVVRNAPSPAATSSLAIAEHLVGTLDLAG